MTKAQFTRLRRSARRRCRASFIFTTQWGKEHIHNVVAAAGEHEAVQRFSDSAAQYAYERGLNEAFTRMRQVMIREGLVR